MKARQEKVERSGRAALPSMTELLTAADGDARFGKEVRASVTHALTAAVDEARRAMGPSDVAPSVDALMARAHGLLGGQARRGLAAVVNATGIVLHTNLGRAPLADCAIEAITATARGYCNLELDLESGERGRRGERCEELLRELTGCEAALVVNNNAAATMLVLAALAGGREVIVSRGQLIEIGGSYRLPDVMAAGGAVLREVGTTNRTRLSDYSEAIGERTAMLMRVHPSNYRVVGFAESPGAEELGRLARERRVHFFDDLGSGAIVDDAMWRAAGEPMARESLRAGADVVSFSGDKLLGGPQAGIVLGRREVVERIRKHPMARAVRIDKLTVAALQVTLELYLEPERAVREIPTLAMLRASEAELRGRAEGLAAELSAAFPGESFEVAGEESFAGGGALPAWPMATFVVRWHPTAVAAGEAARLLRTARRAVLVRVREGAILFDSRTVSRDDHAVIVAAIAEVVGRK